MAKFSFHCENYKVGQVAGLDKHNRRLNKHYSNTDIRMEKSHNNRIYVEPNGSLYQKCKSMIDKKVIASGGRITKASNWLTEYIFSFPDEFPLERLDEYNSLIIQYMGARLGTDNIAEAICHIDEGGLAHLHLDVIPITADNRLSSKTLITRDFITSVHNALPLVLQHHGFNVERGNISNEHTKAGRSAKEYKKAVDKENEELNKKLDDMTKEYNDLAEQYNNLLKNKKDLEQKEKVMGVSSQQEYSR